MRIKHPFIPFIFLLFCCAVESCFGGSTRTTSLLPLQDPDAYRNLQALSQTIANAPSIFTGAGAPAFTPQKTGDIYVSTTTSKIYISTGITTSSSWAILN